MKGKYPHADLLIDALQERIDELEAALKDVVKCNDEAMPNPVTQQWLTSPCRESCLKVLEEAE